MKKFGKNVMQMCLIAAIVAMGQLSWAADPVPQKPEGVININTATLEELTFLPGIGPAKAEAIIKQRAAHPFKSFDQLLRIKGIGRKTLKNIQPWLRLEGPTTVKAKLKLPPKSAESVKRPATGA